MQNYVRLDGEKCFLSPVRTDEEALQKYVKWMNDAEIAKWIGRNSSVLSFNDEKRWTEKERDDIMFNIILKGPNTLIGNCSIKTINRNNAELGICIGEPTGRNKGVGTEVIKMLIKFCFEEIGFHRVSLKLNAENIRAHKCYENAGMRDCGVAHDFYYCDGHYVDCISMEILEQEYFAKEVYKS